MYHGIGRVEEDPFGLFVSPERLAGQLQILRVLGLRGASLVELGDAAARGDADGLVGLTFDDGYRDVLTFAAPLVARHGFTATMFAVSGLLGGENVWDPPPRRQLMTGAALRALAAHGWEIGSHSVSHARLTEVDPDRLRHEVAASGPALADVTGVSPRTFCYPYGAVDRDAVAAVRAAGYAYACAVTRDAELTREFALPRIGVTERDRGPRFAAKLVLRGR